MAPDGSIFLGSLRHFPAWVVELKPAKECEAEIRKRLKEFALKKK
jgi:hypothetical protein